MQWQDEGLVLTVRPHGERGRVLSVFTKDHGRHLGLCRSGQGTGRSTKYIHPGDHVEVVWRARLEDHLGAYTYEKKRSTSAEFFEEPFKLLLISSLCSLLEVCLPERDAHLYLYEQTMKLIHLLSQDPQEGVKAYIKWELLILEELGFALKLDHCAVTGSREGLTHVSPKTARAVTLQAAEPYVDKLLPLPAFILEEGQGATLQDLLDGLRLTGYFLDRHSMSLSGRSLPPSRSRFIECFRKESMNKV